MEIKETKETRAVYVCGGAADVGELTDRAARRMDRKGIASMSCMAGIGARDADITFKAEYATRVLLMDGCPKACSRRTFENAKLYRFAHFDLSAIGLIKSKSPVTEENIQRVVEKAAAMLAGGQKTARASVTPNGSHERPQAAETNHALQPAHVRLVPGSEGVAR